MRYAHKLKVEAPFGVFASEPMRVREDGQLLYTYPGGRLLTLDELAAAGCKVRRVTPGYDVYGGSLWG